MTHSLIDHYFSQKKTGRKFSADQPRVPAGNPDGGQWTSGGESAVDRLESVFSPDLNEATRRAFRQEITATGLTAQQTEGLKRISHDPGEYTNWKKWDGTPIFGWASEDEIGINPDPGPLVFLRDAVAHELGHYIVKRNGLLDKPEFEKAMSRFYGEFVGMSGEQLRKLNIPPHRAETGTNRTELSADIWVAARYDTPATQRLADLMGVADRNAIFKLYGVTLPSRRRS